MHEGIYNGSTSTTYLPIYWVYWVLQIDKFINPKTSIKNVDTENEQLAKPATANQTNHKMIDKLIGRKWQLSLKKDSAFHSNAWNHNGQNFIAHKLKLLSHSRCIITSPIFCIQIRNIWKTTLSLFDHICICWYSFRRLPYIVEHFYWNSYFGYSLNNQNRIFFIIFKLISTIMLY